MVAIAFAIAIICYRYQLYLDFWVLDL